MTTKISGLGRIVLAGTLALTGLSFVAGCGKEQPTQPTARDEYFNQFSTLQQTEKQSQLEGKIVKVQPSHLSFGKSYHTYGYNIVISSNHEFEYVMVEGKDGKLTTLIYPYSKAILERDATINYKPLPSKSIQSWEFISEFMSRKYVTDDNFVIKADGIITADGIKYKTDAEK